MENQLLVGGRTHKGEGEEGLEGQGHWAGQTTRHEMTDGPRRCRGVRVAGEG